MKTYTKQSLVSIKITDKEIWKSGYPPRWQPRKKFLGILMQTEGWRYPFCHEVLTDEYLLEETNVIEINHETKELWLRPKIELALSNGDRVKWSYDTLEEAEDVYKRILDMNPSGNMTYLG